MIEKIIESSIVHFRVGEDLGLRLMEIAQEHLTENNDPVKAIKTITESLQGCSETIAVRILMGKMVLPVDAESQQIICQDRIVGEHDRFPKLDAIYFMESRTRNIKSHGGYIIDALKNLQYQISQNNDYFDISFNYKDVFKFIAGDNEALLEELRDNREIDGIASLFETAKRFIVETMKTQKTMEWLMNTCDEFNGELEENKQNYENYLVLREEVIDVLISISHQLNLIETGFRESTNDNLQKYIDAAREIDEILSKYIEPVDIMSNWSAGWLAPNGDFYGLNGEISNLLHKQIADALQKKGIIPEDKCNEVDGYLEQQGWVRVHGNEINFAGCLNDKIGLKNVQMTSQQLKKIYEYGALCHNGTIKAGWRMEQVSAIRFKDMIERNPEAANKKYFEF